jgi:hypothetical protein
MFHGCDDAWLHGLNVSKWWPGWTDEAVGAAFVWGPEKVRWWRDEWTRKGLKERMSLDLGVSHEGEGRQMREVRQL